MNTQTDVPQRGIKSFFLNDKAILLLITINALVLFLQGFKREFSEDLQYFLFILDNIFSIIFVVEMFVKIAHYGFSEYWKVGWNKFDFILILLSLPSLALLVVPLDGVVNVSYLLVFRVFRVFKFFRLIQFFPRVEHIFRSVQQALQASVMVLLGFFVVIFIMSIIACYFYQDASEEMFGNPIKAYYTTFQVFTIEGWNSIPQMLLDSDAAKLADNDPNTMPVIGTTGAFFTKIFFIALFILGGVFGLSIVNSIFVDAMISDNNEEKEEFKEALDQEGEELKTVFEKKMNEMQQQMALLLEKIDRLEKK